MEQKEAEYQYHLKQIIDISGALCTVLKTKEYLEKELDKSKEYVKIFQKENYND